MLAFTVVAPDGLVLGAIEAGNPDGPEIVFIHGMSQCSLCWAKQFSDPGLTARFRLVAYDLRGHGASDKPSRHDAYTSDRLWANDLAAVMAKAKVKRPVLVAWSFAGRVVTDYLRHYGQKDLAGINFVGAVTKSGSDYLGPAIKYMGPMTGKDLAADIAATRAFVRDCFAKPPSTETYETMLAYNMRVPAGVRAAATSRTANPGDLLPQLTVPVLITHGTEDRHILPNIARYTAETVPGARLSLYEGIGHAPFEEDAGRFNRELAEFVQAVAG